MPREANQVSKSKHATQHGQPPPPPPPLVQAGGPTKKSGPGRKEPWLAFRAHVLRLRQASDAESVTAAVAGVRSALLAAASKDVTLDDGMLGMAASQCARHGQQELMGLLCAHAACRLGRCSGRTVAELASASVKLGCVEKSFARAVVNFCASLQAGVFSEVRDVAMLLLALPAFSDIDRAPAACGLAQAALPHLGYNVTPRDLAEFTHALAHVFSVSSNGNDLPAVVREAFSLGVCFFKHSLHRANARDVTMVAGAVATIVTLVQAGSESEFRSCLLDVVQLVRFRRAEFNAKDLSLLAMAFAKVDLPSPELADVLSDQHVVRVSSFSSKDLAHVLWAAARLPAWSSQPFVATFCTELSHRDLTHFLVRDLCSLSHSLAKLGAAGYESLGRIADESFQRQLYQFSCKDKAQVFWALAKARCTKPALLHLLVRSLAIEDFSTLEREWANAVLWALARVWWDLQLCDPHPQLALLSSLCVLRPWGTGRLEVCCAAWALGQLPTEDKTDVWTSLLAAASALTASACSLHESSNLLSGLAVCPASFALQRDKLAARFIAEISQGLRRDDKVSSHDAHLLATAFAQSSWMVPPEILELISFVARSAEDESLKGFVGPGEGTVNSGDCKGFVSPKCDAAAHNIQRESHSSTSTEMYGGAFSATGTSTFSATAFGDFPPASDPAPTYTSAAAAASTATPAATGSCGHCDQDGAGHDHGHVHDHAHNHGQSHDDSHGQDDHAYGHAPNHGHGHSYAECTAQCTHDCCTDYVAEPCSRHTPTAAVVCSAGLRLEQIPQTPDMFAAADPECPLHGLDGDMCLNPCCPAILSSDGHPVRVNAHCNFHGHCIQLKNTFVHIECSHSDSETEGDCLVCNLSRSRAKSADHDDLQRARRVNSGVPLLLQPPGIKNHAPPALLVSDQCALREPTGDGLPPTGDGLPQRASRGRRQHRRAQGARDIYQ